MSARLPISAGPAWCAWPGEIQEMRLGSAATRKNSRIHCEMVTRRMSAELVLARRRTRESAPGRLANSAVGPSQPLRFT